MRETGAPCRAAVAAAVAFSVMAAAIVSAQLERKAQPRPILIIGGTLIDGSGASPVHNAAILIDDGRIKSAGLTGSRRAPKDARQIDATGKWIIPGLIDGDVHLYRTSGLDSSPDRLALPGAQPYRQILDNIRRAPAPYLRAYVCSGVTGIVNLGGPDWLFDVRDSRQDDALSPRIAFSGPTLATALPAAFQLEDGPFRQMKAEAGVQAEVGRLAGRKADLISIRWVSTPRTDASAESRLAAAAITAAHAARLRAAVEATSLETARLAVEAGADVLVGGIADRPVDDGFIASLVRQKVVYVPALASWQDESAVERRAVQFEPIERECAPPSVLESFAALKDVPGSAIVARTPPDAARVAQANLKRIAAGGGLIAAGSGAGGIRTLHGPSIHRELALMVEAGMSPMQAIVSATANGALLMGRAQEMGRIKAGMLADLVVLDADPLAGIGNTRRISSVIRGGTLYER